MGRGYREFGEKFQVAPRRRRSGLGFWLRRLVLVALLLFLLPYLLLPLYRLNFVHPVSTLMVYDMARGEPVTRDWVEFDAIAPVLVQSVMMSEDARFCAHNGIDWDQLSSMLDNTMEGERTRGASTIPMQVAKNLFLWQSRSYLRKTLEIPLAMAADYVWPKRRMMEIYLNVAEWGPGIFGIEAAANHHFGVSARDLSARQAALLAVTLPNPTAREPAAPGPGLSGLADTIQARARNSGAYIGCLYG